jgi:transcriptional regulator with XRE-family HTH domain
VQKSINTAQQQILQRLLRQVRVEAGLTQVELAERLNTSHSRISDYERGERRLDLVQLNEYCDALGISLVSAGDSLY